LNIRFLFKKIILWTIYKNDLFAKNEKNEMYSGFFTPYLICQILERLDNPATHCSVGGSSMNEHENDEEEE